jgi:hypothetical protein
MNEPPRHHSKFLASQCLHMIDNFPRLGPLLFLLLATISLSSHDGSSMFQNIIKTTFVVIF